MKRSLMNRQGCRKALGFLSACLVALGASAIDITTDTTVTGTNIAAYTAADIHIAEGASLTLLDPDMDYTFTGALSGGGNFVCRAASAGERRMTLSGDSPAFSGGFFFTNVAFYVSSPAAIGNARQFTADYDADLDTPMSQCVFDGQGAYDCACDFKVQTTSWPNRGLKLNHVDTELAGAVTWRGGRVFGPGKITGYITSDAWLYASGDVHIAGGASVPSWAKFTNDGSPVWIDSVVTGPIWINQSTVHFGCANALLWAVAFSGAAATLDLNGWDQKILLYPESNVTITSEKPATLTLQAMYENRTLGNLDGAVSLAYHPWESPNRSMTLAGANNTTTGFVQVAYCDCELTLANGVRFVNAATLRVSSEGWPKPRLVVPENATVQCAKSTLEITETGLTTGDARVSVGANGLLVVKNASVTVDGVTRNVAPGDYKAGNGTALGARMLGTGTIRVLSGRGGTAFILR
ncbi:MAG: hypothetical protein ACOX5G_11780 [Kiritimatiellia bacterium]|jgi:hypothetical protein